MDIDEYKEDETIVVEPIKNPIAAERMPKTEPEPVKVPAGPRDPRQA